MFIIIMVGEQKIIGDIEKEEKDNMQIKLDSILSGDISERIQSFEKYSRVKLPDSYIDFIKKYNVGEPITDNFSDSNNSYVIDRFLGFVNEYETSPLGDYDISVVLSQIDCYLTDNPDLIGDELIPIAALFAGNFVCLDFTEDKENPSVCVWDHEESDEFKPVTYKIADSFSEFLDMLV